MSRNNMKKCKISLKSVVKFNTVHMVFMIKKINKFNSVSPVMIKRLTTFGITTPKANHHKSTFKINKININVQNFIKIRNYLIN